VKYDLGSAAKFTKFVEPGVLSLSLLANKALDRTTAYDIKIDIRDPEGAKTLVNLELWLGEFHENHESHGNYTDNSTGSVYAEKLIALELAR